MDNTAIENKVNEFTKLPTTKRAYQFTTKDGAIETFYSLRTGVRKMWELPNEKVQGRYMTVYSALFSQGKKAYYRDDVKVEVVRYEEW